MTFTITPGFFYEPSNASAFPGMDGGLRVATDEVVLTGFENPEWETIWSVHDARGNEYDHHPGEFVGERLHWNVESLHTALEPFLDGTAGHYGERAAEMTAEPGETAIVLSSLDGERIRVAAKPMRDDPARDFPTDAMIGVAVEPAVVAREVLGCYESMFEYVDRAYGDAKGLIRAEIPKFRAQYEDRIDELEAHLDS